jgi:hypothetical protein
MVTEMPYNTSVETVGPGRFLSPRYCVSQFSIEGEVPSMSGRSRPANRLDNDWQLMEGILLCRNSNVDVGFAVNEWDIRMI